MLGCAGHDTWDPPPHLYSNRTVDTACLASNGHHPSCAIELKKQAPVPSVRLYDVVVDPAERNDVASQNPMIVDQMLAKIAAYNATAIPVSWPGGDAECDPALRDGAWGPWK